MAHKAAGQTDSESNPAGNGQTGEESTSQPSPHGDAAALMTIAAALAQARSDYASIQTALEQTRLQYEALLTMLEGTVSTGYKARETTQASMAELASESAADAVPVPASDTAQVAQEADVHSQLDSSGVAFGDFVKGVGQAVAAAQTALDTDLTRTANALSETQIDVIAVFEQQINDDGTMGKGNPIIQKLPLINYLMPTAYQWSRVYLEADMNVSEFNGVSGFNIQKSNSSFGGGINASYGLLSGFTGGLPGISGSLGGGTSSSNQSTNGSYSQSQAVGKLHMEATLEPRSDIQIPRPFVVQKGPRLQITAGTKSPIPDPADPKKQIGSQMNLIATLLGQNGAPLVGSSLSVRVSEPLLDYELKNPTDANGKVNLDLFRRGAAFDPTKPEGTPVTVTIWLGLINAEVSVTL